MIGDTIREMLAHEPFGAFRIVTASGEAYTVRDPYLVALTKSEVFIAHADADRWTLVPYRNITAVETITNGRVKPRRKGRR